MGNGSRELNRKLAGLLSKRGKELLDKGDTETGYAYLQQAQGYDSSMKVPTVALRSIAVNVDNLSGTVRSTGEAWNPGPNTVSYLSVRTELYDTRSSQSIWSKEQKIVDEFVAPMQARETRQFELSGPLTGVQDSLELRVFLNGKSVQVLPAWRSRCARQSGSNGNPSSGTTLRVSTLQAVQTIPHLILMHYPTSNH